MRSLIGRYVDVDEVNVERRFVYTFNAVIADRWRDGRILLAGDAAHMTPQFIGQGMNAGVRDADNLSWKLRAIVQHGADPAILDSYESERRPHAKAMIDLSVLNRSLVSVQNAALAGSRDIALRTVIHGPALGGWVRRAGMKPKPRFRRGQYLGLDRRHRIRDRPARVTRRRRRRLGATRCSLRVHLSRRLPAAGPDRRRHPPQWARRRRGHQRPADHLAATFRPSARDDPRPAAPDK